MAFLFSYVRTSSGKIVLFSRMILRLKKPCFNPRKWSEYYTSKKRLDISSNHTADMIGVKILVSCCLFLIAMQDSLRYCFADDTDSWVFLINPWIWKFQNWAKDSIFRGRSIENSLKYFLRWNSRGCWLSNLNVYILI